LERGPFQEICRCLAVCLNVSIDVVLKEAGLRLEIAIVSDVEEGGLLRAIKSVLDVYVCVCDVVSCPTALRVFSHEM
jgi:hypothetical protein